VEMKKMKYIIFGVVAIFVIILIYVISTYNSLVKEKNKVRTNWSQIDVVLKRRSDLIPNLLETVKGYTTHEKETLEATISARNKYLSANTSAEKIEANTELSAAVNRVMLLAEAYPELKADTSFVELQKSLKESEDKIQFARQFYNDSVYTYTNRLESFPSSIIANMFNFEHYELYLIEDFEKETPKVKF